MAANEEEIERVTHALRQSIKVLTRNLQDNPNLEGNMLKIQGERGSLETLLVNTAHELQFASFNSLEDVVEKEQRRIEHMRVVLAREKELSDTVARLKHELNEERTSFEKEVLTKNEKIAELKERLQEKKTETAIELRYLGKESKVSVPLPMPRVTKRPLISRFDRHITIVFEERATKRLKIFKRKSTTSRVC